MWLANYLGFPHCFWFGNDVVFHPVATLTAKETWPAFCFLSSSLSWLGLHAACQVTDAKSLYKKVKQLRLEITYANICIFFLFFCIWLNGKCSAHSRDRNTETCLTIGAYGLQSCRLLAEAVNIEHFKRNSEYSSVTREVLKRNNSCFVFVALSLSPTPSCLVLLTSAVLLYLGVKFLWSLVLHFFTVGSAATWISATLL